MQERGVLAAVAQDSPHGRVRRHPCRCASVEAKVPLPSLRQVLGWVGNRGSLLFPLNLPQYMAVVSLPITPAAGVGVGGCGWGGWGGWGGQQIADEQAGCFAQKAQPI